MDAAAETEAVTTRVPAELQPPRPAVHLVDRRAPQAWVWTVVRSPAELEPWLGKLDELCARRQLPALASPAWLGAFWEGFAAGHQAVSVHLLQRGGRLVAALPLCWSGTVFRWASGLDNEHVPYWSAPIDDDPEVLPAVAAELLRHVMTLADRFELHRLPLDGRVGRALQQAAAEQDLPTAVHESPTPEVGLPLEGPWPTFEASLSKNLRRDARQLAKLEALGRVQLEVVEGGPGLPAALAACLALEASGWKGREGTPVLNDPRARQFYERLAELAAARGQLALYLLKLDGRVIAFEYDLRAGGRIECLKIGYDETLQRYSPGTVLRMMLLRRAIERKEANAYHLGRDSEWKRRWCRSSTRIGALQIFSADRRGRLAHLLGPVVRGQLKRLPGVKETVALALEVEAQVKAWSLRRRGLH